MSIALNIIKIAKDELEKANGKKIEKIHLSVGNLSGIVSESLKFALEASKNNSPLAGAEIIIDDVPAEVRCLNCSYEFLSTDFYTTCPKCNTYKLEVLTGKELLIKSLTVGK